MRSIIISAGRDGALGIDVFAFASKLNEGGSFGTTGICLRRNVRTWGMVELVPSVFAK